MSYGHRLEAEYESGLILREQPEDISVYRAVDGKAQGNCYTDILHHLATEHGHGRLVRFAIYPEPIPDGGHGLEIDWRTVPDGAEPVYYREMMATTGPGGAGAVVCTGTFFGYRYPAEDGSMVSEIQQLEDPAEVPSGA